MRIGIMVKATGKIIQWIAQRTENPMATLSIVACNSVSYTHLTLPTSDLV